MTEQQDVEKTHSTTPDKPVNAKKTRWRTLLYTVAAVLFLVFALLFFILATNTGQRWAIKLVDKTLDNLSIEQVEGGLQEGLLLKNVRFESAGVQTHLEQARLQADLGCIWHITLCLNDLTLQKPHIQINTANLPPAKDKPVSNTSMKRIHLPVSLNIEQVFVDQLRLVIDDNTIDLAHFQTAATLNNETGLTLHPTFIDGLQVKTQSKPEEKQIYSPAKPSMPIDWTKIEERLASPLLEKLERVDLPFDIHLNQIQGKGWHYQHRNETHTQAVEISHINVKADAIGQQVNLHQIAINSSVADIQSHGQIQLNDAFPIDFTLNSQIHEQQDNEDILLPASEIQLRITGNLKKQTTLSLQTTGALHATLTAQVGLNQAKTPFELTLDAKDFRYPFSEEEAKPFQIPQLHFNTHGDLFHYQLQLATSAEGMNVPKTTLNLQAKGELQSVDIEQLHLDTLQGSADMQGKIGWRDGVQWYSDLQLNQLNLSEYLAGLPTILSGNVFSTGLITDEVLLFDIPELNLTGTLSNRPLAMKGILSLGADVGLRNPSLKAPVLLLSYGRNNLHAEGFIGQESELNLAINAPDLRGLVPNLAASLQGNVKLTGNISQPALDVDLTGERIQFNDLNLNNITLKGHTDLSNQSQGELTLQLDKFNYGDVKLDQAMLRLQGNEPAHQLTLTSQGSPIAPKLNIQGHFDRATQIWQGSLNQIAIQSQVGNWRTDQNIALTYDNNKIQAEISAHCWQNPNIELCFPQAFQAGKTGAIPFHLKKFNLALINQFVEQELLTGQLQSQGDVAWFTDKPVELNLQLNGENLHLAHKMDYRTFKLAIPKLSVTAALKNNDLALKSQLSLQDKGNINTDLNIKDLMKTRQLGGTLTLRQLNLNLVNQLLSNNENVNGDIVADLKFGGTLAAPLLNGEFHLSNLSAKMKALPFDISQGELTLNFNGAGSTLRGYLQTPDSRLNLEGDASWQNLTNWNSRLHAQAEQFKVDIPSMAKLKISPNIEVKASPKRLELSGNIDIPWARIEIESLPESAVSVSRDEVILDGKPHPKLNANLPAKTKSGMEIISDLKINIEREVYLNAYGLKTHLSGLLSVRQEKGNLGLFGQINLLNGRYASFGQDLLIRKGMISFSGQPSQPMLNIEAIRNPESMDTAGIVAGIKVLGLAESPEIKVFSEPAMSQDQALSYVLTGRSLENSGEAGSGGSIGAALLGLGLAKSGKVVGGLGQAFGIQDLNLGTQGVGDSSKVVVSGNITPRLQVKYGVGLFDGLAEFTVRYRLLPKLYLQSVSGVTQAVDVLYQFEF
ncbi:autotransporter assembly complex protein TamB [Pasteurella sp. P03HT]